MAGASEDVAIQDEKPEPSKADSFAEGIIKGLQDFKEGRITRLKDADELADHLLVEQLLERAEIRGVPQHVADSDDAAGSLSRGQDLPADGALAEVQAASGLGHRAESLDRIETQQRLHRRETGRIRHAQNSWLHQQVSIVRRPGEVNTAAVVPPVSAREESP